MCHKEIREGGKLKHHVLAHAVSTMYSTRVNAFMFLLSFSFMFNRFFFLLLEGTVYYAATLWQKILRNNSLKLFFNVKSFLSFHQNVGFSFKKNSQH